MEELFWSVFSSGPILDCLGQHLEIAEIVNLSRTCHGLSGIYHELMPQCWDVDRLLKRFVKRPKEFRYQIGLAEALITGSFALEFFERPQWQAPNIDIVVRDERGVKNLMAYLDYYEAYVADLRSCGAPASDMPHGFRYVDQIFICRKRTNPLQTIRLYLISPHSFPIKSVIEGSWTTNLINFISYRMAYSIFPSSTFINRRAYMTENLGRNWDIPLQKYRDRDYKFEILSSALESRRNHPMQKCRKTHDKFSWRIPLKTAGMCIPRDLDPMQEGDDIRIREDVTELECGPLCRLGFAEACGSVKEACKKETCPAIIETRNYEIKYMRYSGFFT